ncbi:hypothetical protein N0V90_012816 [Kalmusia sp. IMI 367209]|nr:hypothetical protein N0V90_012816 [Kalmusia sp. IMI 367209]
MPGLVDHLSIRHGYYWHNASWGVNASVANARNQNGSVAQLTQLNEAIDTLSINLNEAMENEAMDMLSTNASLGVATFAYKNQNGSVAQLTQLNEAMDTLSTNASLGVGTFAISVTGEYELQNTGSRLRTRTSTSSASSTTTSTTSRRRTTAIGLSLSDDLANESEVFWSRPAVMDHVLSTTESLLGGTDANPSMSAIASVNKAGPGNQSTTTNTADGLL